jgi:hypothetical protein
MRGQLPGAGEQAIREPQRVGGDASLEPPDSNAHLRVDLTVGDCRHQPLMITLILVGVDG